MKQTMIAAALRLSTPTVSRLVRKGMPVDSIDAARAWRNRYIRPRMPPLPRRAAPDPPPPLSAPAQAAVALAEHTGAMLEAGHDIDALVPALRAALHAVPEDERPRLELPADVFGALVAAVLHLVQITAEESGDGPCELSDDEADAMGAFWFAVAAGEITPA